MLLVSCVTSREKVGYYIKQECASIILAPSQCSVPGKKIKICSFVSVHHVTLAETFYTSLSTTVPRLKQYGHQKGQHIAFVSA